MNQSYNTKNLPWISRKIANQLYDKLVRAAAELESAVHVYLIRGPAGSGKTFLSRDLGVRLGSSNGYEPGSQGNLYWPGLLDIFDPSTNSNQGLETRITQGFGKFGFKFNDYSRERELYDLRFKTGYRGPSMEKQRRTIERAFANGLAEVSQQGYPVIPIDTIERLESSTDPVQQELRLQTDTASVVGWLLFQLTEMQRGSFIFLGRNTNYFHESLQTAIETARRKGQRIELEVIDLEALDPEDMGIFYEHRMKQFPALRQVLTQEVRAILGAKTFQNPLSLDMALQALLQTPNPKEVLSVLRDGSADLGILQEKLLEAYLNVLADPKRKTLLHYLAVARNGLFDDLLRYLEPDISLVDDLHAMEQLPFVKVRDVYVSMPGVRERYARHTYFLHDEMYLLYDRQIEHQPTITHRIIEDSQRIARWYDDKTREARELDALRVKGEPISPAVNDLIVESLIYHLRANPRQGYQWFLFEEDHAIRNSISIGLDMRLRDAIGQFVNAAFPKKEEPGYSLSSPVDKENISLNAPDLPDRYRIDSAMLWIKRLSARGNYQEATVVAEKSLASVEILYGADPRQYDISLAELLLWYGQALMYNAKTDLSIEQYQRVLSLFGTELSIDGLGSIIRERSLDPYTIWRVCLVIGRALNNLGFLCWRNKGQYRMAIQYFQQAIPIFKIPSSWNIEGLEEEIANTTDNIARVYSQLGYHSRAYDLVRQALYQRKALSLSYREALSNNSLAIILGNNGQYEKALEAVDDAILEFRGAESGRGVGLGSITRGSILRRRAEEWRDTHQPISSAARDTETAEADLRQAAGIFADDISEPIHLVEVYNELGCCLRTRYLIQREHEGTNPTYLNAILTQGEASFNRSIGDAKEYDFPVEMLDSIQDLSVLYLRAGRLDDAQKCSDRIRALITQDYLIQEGNGLKNLPKENCIDAYYKILGQVEMLEGAIAYQLGLEKRTHNSSVVDRETFLETVRHYVFAVVYFTHYSNETYSLQRTFGRMYERFKKCEISVQTEITHEFIPGLVKNYHLPEESIRGLMADIFGYFP